jgi:Protein of unknown function (DUF2934)
MAGEPFCARFGTSFRSWHYLVGSTASPSEWLAVISSQTESRQMSKPTEEQIKVRAHELWEQAGKPEGREDEFWHQAEKELVQGTTPDEKSTTFLE